MFHIIGVWTLSLKVGSASRFLPKFCSYNLRLEISNTLTPLWYEEHFVSNEASFFCMLAGNISRTFKNMCIKSDYNVIIMLWYIYHYELGAHEIFSCCNIRTRIVLAVPYVSLLHIVSTAEKVSFNCSTPG